jgi:3-dehydroquinate synthetase
MLDASVGGKTGLDTAAGKNLVGAFHPPAAVVMDPVLLRTLPEDEFRNGLAEAVKHAALDGRSHFEWLGSAVDPIGARNPGALAELLRRNLAVKAGIVERDETELGCRALLNLGHTIAHAVEAAGGYTLPHGEAVAMGLVLEARLGEGLGLTEPGTAEALAALLTRFGLPDRLPFGPFDIPEEELLTAMKSDKKNRDGHIRLALLKRIGEPRGSDAEGWTTAVKEEDVRAALRGSVG